MKFFIVATLAFLSVVTAIIIPRDSPDVMVARDHELERRDDIRLSGGRRIVKPVKCETFAPVDCSPFGEGWYFDYYRCDIVSYDKAKAKAKANAKADRHHAQTPLNQARLELTQSQSIL
ncbi:hypothetical protein EHS25_009101 [Saitozyma podzolica]|uniref:Uncharacterized protein n=1 Tax=Saitozyma podzolica TaxID=1890683 RepID=A0A427YKU8_9TREE|nr:hypothetical protein EHS25_009101 [Saitozyma podzolica]